MAKRSRKRRTATTVKDDVDAFLLESGMDKVRRYLSEGRRFESLDGADLRSEWIGAYKKMAAAPADDAARKGHDDLQAEMELRKIEPPFDEVKEEHEAFIAYAIRAIERLQSDPERFAEANAELQADIDAMKTKRATSAKN